MSLKLIIHDDHDNFINVRASALRQPFLGRSLSCLTGKYIKEILRGEMEAIWKRAKVRVCVLTHISLVVIKTVWIGGDVISFYSQLM